MVGGAVRDELLRQKSKDLDYVVQCDSFERMKEIVCERDGEIFVENKKFFTIRAKVPGLGVADFVLPRKDGAYRDGRHPESVGVGSLIDDLSRRDATVNAIAKNVETGEIIDPFGGQQDIQNKVLRAVGDPAVRFQEDALRVFRFIRFSITKGFKIETETSLAMMTGNINYSRVSAERIYEELVKACEVDWQKTFKLLKTYGLLPVLAEKNVNFKPVIG